MKAVKVIFCCVIQRCLAKRIISCSTMPFGTEHSAFVKRKFMFLDYANAPLTSYQWVAFKQNQRRANESQLATKAVTLYGIC